MKQLLLKFLVNAAAFYLAAFLFPSISYESIATLLAAGVVLGIVNLLIRPLIVLLTLPVNLLTLGLFTLVINTWMVMLTGSMVGGLQIRGFWVAFGVAIIIAVLNMIFF